MTLITVFLIALFLPLFPFSLGFNLLLKQVKYPLLKGVFLTFWPLIGLSLFSQLDVQTPLWVLWWAAVTSLLYAYRLLTERDINTWAGFLATSIWSLFWIPLLLSDVDVKILMTYALGFGIPLTMILLLANQLKKRFGIAYTHLYGGLATTMPRFSGLLLMSVFASIATPVFPGFFVMLKMLTWVITTPAIAIILLLTWLLWSWAGIRVIQGLLVGPADQQRTVDDLNSVQTWSYVLTLIVLAAVGLFVSGDLR